MQILLLQDRTAADVREKLKFFLESTYGVTVEEADSITKATEKLKTAKPPMDLVILDNTAGAAFENADFWNTLGATPLVICTEPDQDGTSKRGKVVAIVDRTNFMDNISKTLEQLAEKGTVALKRDEGSQVRIKTKLLLAVAPLKGDIYIRLNKDKFIKLFKEGDVFDLQDMEKYTVKKGVEYLYIRKEQCSEFASKYKTELQVMLKSSDLKMEDVAKLNEQVHETVHDLTAQMGFTKEVQELTKTQVNLTVKAMGTDPKLQDILDKLKSEEGKYIAYHSTLCAYIACAIACQLQWGSESTYQKLTLASFMHDITLSNHELAKLGTLADVEREKSKYTEKEIKEFLDHPNACGDMVAKMNEIPPDVDTIVRQHHEAGDGSGFPRKLTHAYIAPLAVVFICAHDLTLYTLESGDKFDIRQFLDRVKDRYNSTRFKKVLAVVEDQEKMKGLSSDIKKLKG